MRKNLSINDSIVPIPSTIQFSFEISQEGNQNATTRLWVQDDGTVYKQYVIYNDITKKNIDNLLRIANSKPLRNLQELSFPIAIYSNQGRIDGYVMEYHNMQHLGHYLNERNHNIVLRAFRQLADLTNRLPKNVYIGDLHSGNVLVGDDTIRLIDIDGFSLKYGHKISCPLKVFLNHSVFSHKKYHDSKGRFLISRDSDIACVLWLFLTYLMEADPFQYTEAELKSYLTFLTKLGLPKDLYEMIMRMMSPKPNYLIPAAFEMLPIDMLSQCSYRCYIDNNLK